jgi:hypothetical protein
MMIAMPGNQGNNGVQRHAGCGGTGPTGGWSEKEYFPVTATFGGLFFTLYVWLATNT